MDLPGHRHPGLRATRNLLTSLDPLPYRERMRHLRQWARSAGERAEVCADLRGRGGYERHLALVAAAIVQDPAGIAAGLADPVPAIRSFALAIAARAGLPVGDLTRWPAVDRRRI